MSKDRKEEHRQFLDWLITILKKEKIDLLLVSGDIFDTYTPPNYALNLYYNFLKRIPQTPCQSVVIVGGNHDSISTLHAPKDLLKLFNIHIVAGVGNTDDREPLLIEDDRQDPLAIVCPVPFLRDRDIRTSQPGESYEEKSISYARSLIKYYHSITDKAVTMQKHLNRPVPIIATGHFFTLGGKTNDSVRDIFVGNLGQINAADLPDNLDYIALGHLHRAQMIKGKTAIYYSGSPIPLSFSELKEKKRVYCVEINTARQPAQVTDIEIPVFRTLEQIKGNRAEIAAALHKIDWDLYRETPMWLEIIYDTSDWVADIQTEVEQLTRDLPVELLAVKANHTKTYNLREEEQSLTLDDINPAEVFARRLKLETITDTDQQQLTGLFNDVFNTVYNRLTPTEDA